MDRKSMWILISSLLLWVAGAAQGQMYQPQQRVISNPYPRQPWSVYPLDRRMYYPANSNLMGSPMLRGYSTMRYPTPIYSSTPLIARQLQRTYDSLDPMTQLYERSSQRLFGGSNSYSTGSSSNQSLTGRRRSIYDPTPYSTPTLTAPNSASFLGSTYQQQQFSVVPKTSQFELNERQLKGLETAISSVGGTSPQQRQRYIRLDTGDIITGPVNERLLRSTLFSVMRPLTAQEMQKLGDSTDHPSSQRRSTAAGSFRRPIGRDIYASDSRGAGQTEKEMIGSSWSTSSDVFTRMRKISSQFLKPPGTPIGGQLAPEMETAEVEGSRSQLVRSMAPPVGGVDSGSTEGAGAVEFQQPFTAIEAAAGEELRTFVGTAKSRVNLYLAEAEELLRKGQYYKASDMYDLARTVDMDNPLPFLGRAIALLAAGEYRTSVMSLFRALELFESLAHFKIDLSAFVVDLRVLDSRRAYLERQLERYDDFRLRFLLGFAEYYSGFEKLGLENLAKAAEFVPEEFSGVRQFVKTLEQYQSGASSSK